MDSDEVEVVGQISDREGSGKRPAGNGRDEVYRAIDRSDERSGGPANHSPSEAAIQALRPSLPLAISASSALYQQPLFAVAIASLPPRRQAPGHTERVFALRCVRVLFTFCSLV